VQRAFVSLGFELPSAALATCHFQVSEHHRAGGVRAAVSGAGYVSFPGVGTHRAGLDDEPSVAGRVGSAPNVAATPSPLIEIWRTGFNSVAARAGSQVAELNAQAASRIYQKVCLAAGERVGRRLSHRGRQSVTKNDAHAHHRRCGRTKAGGSDCAATASTGGLTRWTYDNAGRVLTRTLPRRHQRA